MKCAVKAISKRHALRHRLRWRLMHGGHAVRHGAIRVGRRLQLNLGHLAKGNYVLRVQGRKGAVVVVR